MTDDRQSKDRKPPASRHQEKLQDRRARQAQALRRNLARRKAQSRGRDDNGESSDTR